ncbi:MAG TPA: chitobiase/beta-hexosaminidase C-terminal domain-containing protein [Granulicella sp.]
MGKLHKVAGKFLIVGLALVEVLAMAGCSSGSSSTSGNQTATPAFSPGGGTYTTSQPVTISDATPGAVLYCTIDGTTPTSSSPQCSQPTTVFQTEFLQAIAVAPNMSPSAVASAGYTINLNAAATPTFSPAGGTYTSAQTVTISDTTAGANIYYTTDGTVPKATSATTKLYTVPVVVAASEPLAAIAVASGYDPSGVAIATYIINLSPAPTPVISPNGGAVSSGRQITIADSATAATIYYTTDGTTPSATHGTQYLAPITVTSPETIEAVAVETGFPNSTPASAAFTLLPQAATPSFQPGAGAVPSGQQVTITSSSGATIYYAIGTTPTTSSSLYAGPVTVTAAETINAIAVGSAYSPSNVGSAVYTIQSSPVVTAINPTTGTTAGGTSVNITGSGFTGAASVNFGSAAATSVTVNSATSITAVSPAGSSGTVDIRVVTPGGTSPISAADQFTYAVPLPVVQSITPTVGPTAGGTSVVISGTNFTKASAVNFGSTAAASFNVTSASSITAVSPAGSNGTVDITVVSPNGTSTTSSADQFTYASGPAVGSISPSSGPIAGGTPVTINGTNFTGATAVKFGSTAAASFTVVPPGNSITTVSPAGSNGTVDITVVMANGTSTTSNADQFTYELPVPTVTGIKPSAGAIVGGTAVAITGTNFTNVSAVNFGGTAATGVTVNSTTSISAVSPAGSDGTVDVTVVSSSGTSATSSADQFTYGSIISGQVISGSDFINGATVQLYAAGTSGYGAGSSALTTVPSTVTTDANGNFSLLYTCPVAGAPGDQMYLVATGGDSGSGSNSSIALMAALGTCSKLPSSVTVNEVTTVASAYALSAFATVNASGGIVVGAPGTGSSCNAASGWQSTGQETCNYTGLVNAFNAVNNLVNISTGTALTHTPAYPTNLAGDPKILNNSTVPTTRINALADMLASCVESSGSGCDSGLFSATTTIGSTPVTPSDTLQAALNIAQNPGNNVTLLLGLVSSMTTPPYSIGTGTNALALTGTAAPVDLTLALTFTGAGLGIYPASTTLSDGNLAIANGALGIDAAGNIWVGAFRFTTFNPTDGEMIAEFNALGAPVTPATTLSSATRPVPAYGGYNPQPSLTAGAGITALTIDQSGNLWTSNGSPNSSVLEQYLLEISPSLSLLNTYRKSGAPTSVAVDGSGDVWFSTIAPNVDEFLANGSAGVTGVNLSASVSPGQGYLAFDSSGGMWLAIPNASGNSDVFQLSTSNGSVTYDAFPTSTTGFPTTLAADGSGNIYGCDPTGANLDVFSTGALANSYPIKTGRACGSQLVLDGQGHLFAVLVNGSDYPIQYLANIDEFTTAGTLISPLANGYTGSSSTEAPTLNADTLYVGEPVPGISAAIDRSGNLWVLNPDTDGTNPSTFALQPGNVLVEFVGIGAPVVTPASTALTAGMLGARP